MQDNNSLLNTRKFLPLFSVLFLNASNDHLLRNAVLVMLAYQGVTFAGLSVGLAVNVSSLIFILPFFMFSSYAGKIADSHNKVAIIKQIKYYEFLIVLLAGLGFYLRNPWLMLLALFTMGIHSAFFGPIKYSILPAYLTERKSLLLANGFVELGTFVATLVGQILGSWYMANYAVGIVVGIMFISTLSGLIFSYRLSARLPKPEPLAKLEWNVFRDIRLTYRTVITTAEVRNNIHAISWFWAMGIIYTTQLPIFAAQHMGGSAHVFSFLLALFSISIGVGSLVCAKLSNGHVQKGYVVLGAAAISLLSLLLLSFNQPLQSTHMDLSAFSQTFNGRVNFVLIFLIGFFAGFYSVTCYNHLQVSVPAGSLSRVIAVNNILNAGYMVLASLVCTLLLLVISLWWLFVVFVIVNTLFVIWYWRANLSSKLEEVLKV